MNELREKRQRWVDANRDNQFADGIERLLTDLYPDKAHFIYELLQNAEDAQATEIHFNLSMEELIVRHNGKRTFNENDIESITSIGNSSKRDDYNSIGKFGVGFKAVFAYTKTPRVFSGRHSFEINDLVVPNFLDNSTQIDNATRFEFPFNNAKKSPIKAFNEIISGLCDLKPSALLFLNNLTQITWEAIGGLTGSVKLKNIGNQLVSISYTSLEVSRIARYLKFSKKINNYSISIAFKILKKEGSENTRPLIERVKIGQENECPISVYFPTEQISGLKFHIHAPFSATVARDNIAASEENGELMHELANLLVESLPTIKSLNLLTPDFLAVLPNKDDNFVASKGVEVFRDEVIIAFKDYPLLPTINDNYCMSHEAISGTKESTQLFDHSDLTFLNKNQNSHWVKLGSERYRSFLATIDVQNWTGETILKRIVDIFNHTLDNNESSFDWLRSKSYDWLRQFYLFLDKAGIPQHSWQTNYSYLKLGGCKIAPVYESQRWGNPESLYFLPKSGTVPSGFSFLDPLIFGEDTKVSETLKSFFKNCGTDEIDENALLEKILEPYESGKEHEVSDEDHINHIKQILSYSNASYFIDLIKVCQVVINEKNQLVLPSRVYIDRPYKTTHMERVNAVLSEKNRLESLSTVYQDSLSATEFDAWLNIIIRAGSKVELNIAYQHVGYTQNSFMVATFPTSNRKTNRGSNCDYVIECLDNLLKSNDEQIMQLIWNLMVKVDSEVLTASYSPNQQCTPIRDHSDLVKRLRSASWIPVQNGDFLKPSNVNKYDLLPEFIFDDRNGWLTAIHFGNNTIEKTKEAEVLGSLGIDKSDLALLNILKNVSPAKKQKLIQDLENEEATNISLPSAPVNDIEAEHEKARRSVQVAQRQYTEERSRTIRITLDKKTVKDYLRPLNTNKNGQIVCQMCDENMPFKVDGKDYFEAVEFVDRSKEHVANYLALCPNCAAEFQHACPTDDDSLIEQVIDLNENQKESELLLIIDTPVHQYIRFTQQHLIDLKAVVQDK